MKFLKRRTFVLMLAAALSLLGATALAAGGDIPGLDGPAVLENAESADGADLSVDIVPDTADGAALSSESEGNDEGEPGEENSDSSNSDSSIEEYIPDPEGALSFHNMGRRMRENNLNVLALEENIQVIRSIDYDELKEDLRKGLNEVADAQWGLISAGSKMQIPTDNLPDDMAGLVGGINQALFASVSMSTSSAAQSLQAQYDAMRDAFDDIKDGKLQADNEDLIWQLENAQNQIIMAGQTLYIALADMEESGQTLNRSLDTLDRQLEELELRYKLGHISAQTLKQAKAGRTSLLSGQQTLDSNIEIYKMQLELLIGAQLTGDIRLGALPQVSDEELEAMDLEADLESAKAASYSLYEARQTLEDAEKDYKDAGRKYNYSDKHYEYVQAQHQWQAAQYNYSATVQNFEMGLRTLYLQVKDNRQVLEAARAALSIEQSNYAVAQLKHTQGTLSQNALLEAEDKVKQAQEAIDSAVIDLFSNYHNYRWAVDYGILN